MRIKRIILLVLLCSISFSLLFAQSVTDSIAHYRSLAQIAIKAKDYRSYQKNIEKIVQLNPNDYMSRFMLARAYVINNNKEKAIEQLSFLAKNNYDLIVHAEKDQLLLSLGTEPGFEAVEDYRAGTGRRESPRMGYLLRAN